MEVKGVIMALIDEGTFVDWVSLSETYCTKAGKLVDLATQLPWVDLPVYKDVFDPAERVAKWCGCLVFIQSTPQTRHLKEAAIVTMRLIFSNEYDKRGMPIFDGCVTLIPTNSHLNLSAKFRADQYKHGVLTGYAKALNMAVKPGKYPPSTAKCLIYLDRLAPEFADCIREGQIWMVRVVELIGYLKESGLPVYVVMPLNCVKPLKRSKQRRTVAK